MGFATNPRALEGPWEGGYALDAHSVTSEFLGYDPFGHAMYDTQRTELGEALFQLKYRADPSRVAPIADTVASFFRRWCPDVDLLVPVPPSKAGNDVVRRVGEAVASILELEFCPDCLWKESSGKQVKNLGTVADRAEHVEGTIRTLAERVAGRGVLLIDDLFQTGTTLGESARALKRGGSPRVSAVCLTYARRAIS